MVWPCGPRKASKLIDVRNHRLRPIAIAFRGLILCTLALVHLTMSTYALPATPKVGDAPISIQFPRDDGPHNSNIEWWYFTGHLQTSAGNWYGFEYVAFRARQSNLEGYVSHFAVTDDTAGTLHFGQKILGAAGVSGRASALDLDLRGWTMRGANGSFALSAEIPGYALNIDVQSAKPAALHDGDGYIDYGAGMGSYYYSWTRLRVSGTIDTGSGPISVTGMAWMDHQWGNFQTYEDGGWDWYSVQLDNGVDVMLYILRRPDGGILRVDGSIVAASGALTALHAGDFTITPLAEWTSPETKTTYPSGWSIEIPAIDLAMTITPTVQNQELDTRPTTGVIYWEGESLVKATMDGDAVAGRGYVELTGYAPYVPVDLSGAIATPAP
jgi:predicted secreted hydrolase